jgi:uncharacterized membrane protein HdeD (DUF308 family)
MRDLVSRNWWAFAIRGIAAIIFGVLALVSPEPTIRLLVILFGAYALVDGMSLLVALVRGEADARAHAWSVAIMGSIGVVVGIVTFAWPNIAAMTLLYVVAFWTIALGALQIVAAIQIRREIEGELWMALGGALSVAFGLYLVMNPSAGMLSLIWITGVWAAVFGVSSLALALRLRRIAAKAGPSRATATATTTGSGGQQANRPSPMASPFTTRQAARASMAAAALILISQLSQVVGPMIVSESFWFATQSVRYGLALVAMFVLLIALTGLYARQTPDTAKLGLIGYVTASLGTLLVAGDWWHEAFAGPVLREKVPELLATAPGGTLVIGATVTSVMFAAGWVIFGLASIRAGVFPRRRALLMTVAGVAGVLTLVSPFQIPLAVAVGWMGLWLDSSERRDVQQPGSQFAAVA